MLVKRIYSSAQNLRLESHGIYLQCPDARRLLFGVGRLRHPTGHGL